MITTIGQSKKRCDNQSGFTLIEVLVSVALLSLIISVGLTALTFISQSSTSLSNYSIMSHQSRNALEEFSRDIRMGFRINKATVEILDFDIFGKAGTTSNIRYEYSAVEDKLFRTEDSGAKEEVLDDLAAFQFNYFNLRKIPTNAIISIKEVQIEGLVKKNALAITNTNYIISARFMMRNRSVSN